MAKTVFEVQARFRGGSMGAFVGWVTVHTITVEDWKQGERLAMRRANALRSLAHDGLNQLVGVQVLRDSAETHL